MIKNASEIDRFEEGNILVTGMTDPDWVPIMKKAAGIVTDHGGRTSHAAIVSRELGIAAVIGTGNGTSELEDGQEVTLSCAEGEQGLIYEGMLEYEETEVNLEELPDHRNPDHDEHRQPGCGVPLVASALPRDRSGAHGIHHQQHDPDPSHGAAQIRRTGGQGSQAHGSGS